MGIRICYDYIKDGSSLKSLLYRDYPIFRTWLQKQYKISREEYNEQYNSEALLDFVVANDSLPELSTIKQELLDGLTAEFIEPFSYRNPDILEGIGGHLSSWRYESSTELVEKFADSKTKKLWQYLVTGRSLKNDLPFISGHYMYIAGFWRREEWQYLYQSLISIFGTQEQIKHRYWTEQEKRQYEEAVEAAKHTTHKLVSLVNHYPISTGIECVLQALEEVEGKDVDIIFDIS